MSCEKPFAMELPPSFINGLLTVNTNVNAFHGNERTYAQKSGYNSSVKDAKHVFPYLDLEAYVQIIQVLGIGILPEQNVFTFVFFTIKQVPTPQSGLNRPKTRLTREQ